MTKSVFSDRYRLIIEMLVAARKESRLTQADVARLLSRPQSYVSKIERGERRIDVAEFIDLAEAIGCDPVDLVELAKVSTLRT